MHKKEQPLAHRAEVWYAVPRSAVVLYAVCGLAVCNKTNKGTFGRVFMALNSRQPKTTKWTQQQRRFMEWVATPEELRDHRKLQDYAAYTGINRTTFWKWRNLPGFNDEVQVYCKANLGDALPDVLAALKEFARRGSFPHQKMYLEMLGLYTQRTIIDVNGLAERISQETGQPLGDIMAEAESIIIQAAANKGR